jgi:hypothetical protein
LCRATKAWKKVGQGAGKTNKGKSMKTRMTINRTNLAALIAVWLTFNTVQPNAIAGQRPISDFLSRQGKFCVQLDANGNVDCAAGQYLDDTTGGGCFLFVPQVADYLGWSDPKSAISAAFDYAGLANEALRGALGTTMDGSINEVAQPDGSVIVKVELRTRNALAFAVDGFDFNGPLLFGQRVAEIQAGAEASVGSCSLNLIFRNPAAGAPLPDIEDLLFCRFGDLVFISFVGQADGVLANSQSGRLEVTQKGLIATFGKADPHSRVALDAFPAEHILIQATGK